MYPIQTGQSFMVQQSVTGGGTFDGSEYGRAKCTMNSAASASDVYVAARLYGELANDFRVTFIDPGVPSSLVKVAQSGNNINVTLSRHASLGLNASAKGVSDAINAARVGVVASYEGNGAGLVDAIAATALTGGVDSALRGPNAEQFIWAIHGVNAGFFYFEQEVPVMVHQFEALFDSVPSGNYTVTVSRVNLDSRFEPIAGESIPVFVWDLISTARPDISFSDVGILLHPYQAMKVEVTGNLSGVVRFDVRRTAGYPFP